MTVNDVTTEDLTIYAREIAEEMFPASVPVSVVTKYYEATYDYPAECEYADIDFPGEKIVDSNFFCYLEDTVGEELCCTLEEYEEFDSPAQLFKTAKERLSDKDKERMVYHFLDFCKDEIEALAQESVGVYY